MAATLLMRSTISPYSSDCKLAHPDVVIERKRMFWQFKHVIATVISRIRIIVIIARSNSNSNIKKALSNQP